jgi:hypothetical protein
MAEAETDFTPAPDSGGAAPAPAPAPSSDAPKTYHGDFAGLQEAAEDTRQRREEAEANAISPEQHAAAEEELRRRWGATKGVGPDNIDLGKVTLATDEPMSVRKATAALNNYHEVNRAALDEILADQTTEAAVADGQAEQERQAQIAADEQHIAAEQQRAAAEHQRQAVEQARQQLSDFEKAIEGRQQQYARAAVSIAPELPAIAELSRHDPARAQALLAEFAQKNPATFLQLQQLDQAFLIDGMAGRQAATARQLEAAQDMRAYRAAEERKFMNAHPELADRGVLRDAQDDLLEMYKERGVDEQQLRWLANNDRNFVSAAGHEIQYAALRQWRAEKSLKNLNAHQRPIPPVQRPGVSQGRNGVDVAARLDAVRNSTGTRAIRAGMAALQAKRAAAQR